MARPVTFSSASMRGTHWPTTPSCASGAHGSGSNAGTSTTFVSSRPSTSTFVTTKRLSAMRRPPRHVLNRAHDLGVGAATAEVAAHRDTDVLLGRSRVLLEEGGGGDELARRAEAALDRIVSDERCLERM